MLTMQQKKNKQTKNPSNSQKPNQTKEWYAASLKNPIAIFDVLGLRPGL